MPTVFPIGSFVGAPVLVRVEVLVIYPLYMFAIVLRDPLAAAILLPTLAASVLAHECAHAYAAARQGLAVLGIELNAFGGRCTYLDLVSRARTTCIVAVAGPLANVAIALALTPPAYLMQTIAPWGHIVGDALVMNAGLAAFNLLPALPLDGGRIAYALIEARWSTLAASLVLSSVGLLLGLPLVLIAFVFAFSGFPVVLPLLWLWNWPLFTEAVGEWRDARRRRARRDDWRDRLEGRPKRGSRKLRGPWG